MLVSIQTLTEIDAFLEKHTLARVVCLCRLKRRAHKGMHALTETGFFGIGELSCRVRFELVGARSQNDTGERLFSIPSHKWLCLYTWALGCELWLHQREVNF